MIGLERPSPSPDVLRAAGERILAILPTVRSVGVMLQKLQSEDLEIRTKTNHMDLVTRADVASEAEILGVIRSRFPEDAILAEESGGDPALADRAEFTWAIDPVDGTINYAHGLPLYSVSVAILNKGAPVAALVTQPALATEYRAVTGQGAFCNDQPIRVSPENVFRNGLVVTGFPYNRTEIMDVLLAGVQGILTDARGLRRTGSAALDLCWLAHGRFAGLYELNLNVWDSAGGAVLVQEAGGRLSNLLGAPYDPFGRSVVASNGLVHEELLASLDGARRAALEKRLVL